MSSYSPLPDPVDPAPQPKHRPTSNSLVDSLPMINSVQGTKWQRVFAQLYDHPAKEHEVLKLVLERVSSYYQNIGLISALSLAFLYQQITVPASEMIETERTGLKRAAVLVGVVGLCAFLAAVITIILVDNTSKSITTRAAFDRFCTRFSYLMELPAVFMILGLCLMMTQLLMLVELLYDPGMEYYVMVRCVTTIHTLPSPDVFHFPCVRLRWWC